MKKRRPSLSWAADEEAVGAIVNRHCTRQVQQVDLRVAAIIYEELLSLDFTSTLYYF